MESNNELKEIDIENCTCYYFDGIININYLDVHNTLLDQKSDGNILIYITYKTPYSAKPLCISFNKVDGYIKDMIGLSI